MSGALLCQPLALVRLLEAVLEKVPTLCELGHDVGLVMQLKAVENSDDIVAVFALMHGINL